MKSPLVSIIIPVFNCEDYLDECLQSAVGQTYGNLEIIVVDDGCTDASPDIMRRYEQQDSRIRCIHQPNEGVMKAKKNGIQSARGKYIQYLDSDDSLANNAIELLVDKAESNNADMVVAPFFFCEGTKRIKSENSNFDSITGVEYLRYILLDTAYWATWAKFHLRSLYDNEIESIDIAFGEDVVLSTQLLFYSMKVVPISASTINYRILPSSMSHALNDKAYNNFNAYVSWFESYMKRKGLDRLLAKELACFHVKNTMFRLHWKKYKDADREMKQVTRELRTYPELRSRLSRREKKIVAVYRISRLLGYLNVLRYARQGKI